MQSQPPGSHYLQDVVSILPGMCVLQTCIRFDLCNWPCLEGQLHKLNLGAALCPGKNSGMEWSPGRRDGHAHQEPNTDLLKCKSSPGFPLFSEGSQSLRGALGDGAPGLQ